MVKPDEHGWDGSAGVRRTAPGSSDGPGRVAVRLSRRQVLTLAAAGGAALALPQMSWPGRVRAQTAGADAGAITEYAIPTADSLPGGIVLGPDGAFWFYETGANQIGRITTDSQITEYPIPTANASSPRQGFLAVGPDNAIWFTENHATTLGRVAMDGTIAEFPIPTVVRTHNPTAWENPLLGVAGGLDGAVWFTEALANAIGRITPDGSISEFVLSTADSVPGGIVAGPDGALWFTEVAGNQIGRITTDGQVSEFPIPTANSFSVRLTVGPDNAIWFAEIRGNQIGRDGMDGVFSEYPAGVTGPVGITAGPDGAIWFTGYTSNEIGRLTLDGTLTTYPVPTAKCQPYHILPGPDGAMWFTELQGNKIGRLQLQ